MRDMTVNELLTAIDLYNKRSSAYCAEHYCVMCKYHDRETDTCTRTPFSNLKKQISKLASLIDWFEDHEGKFLENLDPILEEVRGLRGK